MATRSERFRANEQQHPGRKTKTRPGNSKPGVAPGKRSRAKKRVAKGATYALEAPGPTGRPSRKSTRKSANRAKPDTSFNRTEQLKKGSPETRFRKTKARSARPRSHSPSTS
jgi:hypothetical protein